MAISIESRDIADKIPASGLAVTASKKAALPGGVLPYEKSEFGYVWTSNGDGTLFADSRDGNLTLNLDLDAPGGQVAWVLENDYGVVDEGNFSGLNRNDVKLVTDRADRLLADNDSTPNIPSKSRGYDPDYTEQFDAPDWRNPVFMY